MYAKFQYDISKGTILQGVEFHIFLLIFIWALQQCSDTALPVIIAFLSKKIKQEDNARN